MSLMSTDLGAIELTYYYYYYHYYFISKWEKAKKYKISIMRN